MDIAMPYDFIQTLIHKISIGYVQRSSFLLSEWQRILLIPKYRLRAIIRYLCLAYPIHLFEMLKHME